MKSRWLLVVVSRFTFPHFEMKPTAVQPDYEKWQAITVGMSRAEVIEILGPPRKDEYAPGNSRYLNYNFVQLPFCPHSRTYSFSLGFDENCNVVTITDPFNGYFSTDGRPTKPKLIIPAEDQVFSHFPRVLDIRWHPVSGVYPVTYSIEFEYFPFPDLDGAPPEFDWQPDCTEADIVAPFFIKNFGGANPGRVRVQAHNEIGDGEWSESRLFRFTV
jgi:hypothetical protein